MTYYAGTAPWKHGMGVEYIDPIRAKLRIPTFGIFNFFPGTTRFVSLHGSILCSTIAAVCAAFRPKIVVMESSVYHDVNLAATGAVICHEQVPPGNR